ncbi:MAG: formylglycine-generating enzyme family protein, partial [bacterium]|nr:formylglycine-generating enzyme family protein [bacterium]
ALLAGRDQEIAELRRLVRMPVPILGLCAPSGAGKSSLLLGGLVPALRAAPYSTERASGANSTKRACGATPVAVVRHPHEPGIAGRLLGDLLEQSQPVADDDWRGFVERLSEVEALAGEAPLLVLDQFEDVLRPRSGDPEATSPRAMLGVLLAATVRRRPGIDEPPCRWLLAYRQEFHGELIAWLGDVLYDAQTAVVDAIAALPHDLSGAERFHSMPLPLVATPQPGRDALREATRVFREAIGKPLELTRADGTPRYPWHFGPGHAERLARAFAVARLARPEAPLTPELQVVLAHLLGRAGPDGLVEVPDDPGSLIDEALEDHLRRALETAFPSGISDAEQTAARTGRARALLALRELATSTGRREEGLTAVDLARAIGEDGEEILEKLATPLTRLVVLREAPDGFRYVLSHDRMAEVVARMVEEEGRRGKLLVDAELLALRRFVSIKTALFRSQEEQATRLDRRHHRRIADHAEALLWDEERRAWGAACRKRRRADRRRRAGIAAAALIFLALVAWGAWTWARQRAEHRALREQVAEGGPEVALWAFARLSAGPDADLEELRSLLRQRFIELDLGGVGDEERSAMVLRAVEIALPWVEETPEDSVLISNLVWVLDFAPGRDPPFAERARALRDRVLRPLRRLRPPPPLPEPGNPDWVDVPAGSFQISNEGSRQVSVSAFRMLRHEVTNAEYRLLMPDQPGDDDLPAANVSWYEAYTYAAWLGGRLPTEAEWGYAARAGCPYTYCTREGLETTVDEVAWTRRNSRDPESGEPSPQPVMQLEPNPWGLFDMLGNLTEWTADWCRGPQHTWIPVARSVGSRAARGGSYTGGAQRLSFPAPYFKYVDLGFRVVLPGARPSLIDL